MLAFLLSLINPIKHITNELVKLKKEEINADTEEKRIEASIRIKEMETSRDILLREQNNIFTRMVRPLWAFAFIIYTYKIIVWDKVFGWGSTDPLDPVMLELMTVIAGAYFVSRGVEKIVTAWKR